MPAEKPAAWTAHRAGTGNAPTTGEKGTVYGRFSKSGSGPTSDELGAATTKWLKEHSPTVLDSKVEPLFSKKGWEIIWTQAAGRRPVQAGPQLKVHQEALAARLVRW